MPEDDNHKPEENGVESKLILTFNPLLFTLDIKGQISNIEAALSMLAQATRHFENELRVQNAAALAERINDQRQAASIRTMLSRGRK